MKMFSYILKRILVFIPLFFGIMLVTFYLIRLIPGNPAETLAGAYAYEGTIQELEQKMGLDKPVFEQFITYCGDVLQGDLGYSYFTNSSVTNEILKRFPATLEMITLAVVFALAVGVTIGKKSAQNPKGISSKISSFYGLMAGSFADFWIGLMLVYVFFATLGWAPSPMGRLALLTTPPTRITGMFVMDSLLTGNWVALKDSLAHLILPVVTLGFVHGAAVMKMTNSTMSEVLESDYIHHARLLGLSEKKVTKYALRNTYPAVAMAVGTIYSYLLGGAVLIESVFAWGGLGQYVTMAISNKDYVAIQAFLLVATLFSMFMYLIIDIIHMALDPRVKN